MASRLDNAVARATATLKANGVRLHVHDRRCKRLLRHVIGEDEEVIFEIRQSLQESVTPDSIVATNKRLIIVRTSFWGLYFGYSLADPVTYVIIPYKYITGVTVTAGKVLSSIKIHGGVPTTGSQGTEAGAFCGFNREDARTMATFIEEVVEYEEGEAGAVQHVSKHAEVIPIRASFGINLDEARERVHKGAVFVWFGVEPVEEVAKVLGVEAGKVVHRNSDQLLAYRPEELEKYSMAILVSYDGIMAEHVSKMVKKSHGLELQVLKGGMTNAAANVSDSASAFSHK